MLCNNAQRTLVPGCRSWYESTSCDGLRTPTPSEIHFPTQHHTVGRPESLALVWWQLTAFQKQTRQWTGIEDFANN